MCVMFVFVVLLAGSVHSTTDELACCPPSHYILNAECYDPVKNATGPLKFACDDVYPAVNFTVLPGALQIALIDDYYDTYSPQEACYGNWTKYRNLSHVTPSAILCIVDEEEDKIIEEEVLGYCMIVSVVFLAITALVYAAFKELRDLFGKSVINFCGSLAIGLAILSIMKLMEYSDMRACAARGFFVYFFMVAAFFWSNSISIQVLRDTRRPTNADYGWRELKWYMLYSWGMPSVLTIIMAIVNYHPGNHSRPGIGLNHCWFFSLSQQWYYMYSVMTILLLINFAIFIYIATIVWRFSFKSTHIKAVRFKLSMTFRLIILMGLPWIFEMINSVVKSDVYILAIIDVFNCLQGILIFVVLIIRKRVVKVLHQRGLLDWCSGPVERWLAVGDDAETNVVQHTDLPMHDEHNGNVRN